MRAHSTNWLCRPARPRLAYVALVVLALAPGCGRKATEISGTVHYDNVPLADGLIELVPTDGTPGGSCGAPVSEGKFCVSVGVKRGGTYKVVLRGFRKQLAPDPFDPSHSVEVAENFLPASLGETSGERVRVSPDKSENHFDFNVDSKTATLERR